MNAILQAIAADPNIAPEFRAAMVDPMRMAAYVSMLKRHDWWSEFSDDHRVWQEARQKFADLKREQSLIDPDCVVWDQHCPAQFRRFA